jgi:hypothetical protein
MTSWKTWLRIRVPVELRSCPLSWFVESSSSSLPQNISGDWLYERNLWRITQAETQCVIFSIVLAELRSFWSPRKLWYWPLRIPIQCSLQTWTELRCRFDHLWSWGMGPWGGCLNAGNMFDSARNPESETRYLPGVKNSRSLSLSLELSQSQVLWQQPRLGGGKNKLGRVLLL